MTKIKSIPCCPDCGNTEQNLLKASWQKDEPPQLVCLKCGHSDHVGQIQGWFKRIEVESDLDASKRSDILSLED